MILLNALTPVTFIAAYQLIIGNLILGLIESFLIIKLFKQKVSFPIIIAANYVSAIAGFLISCYFLDSTQLNLIRSYENGTFPKSILAYTGIAFVVTLLIEFPFYYVGIKTKNKTKLPVKYVVKILLVINVISYIVTILTWLILVWFKI